jgi:hypothetical protein
MSHHCSGPDFRSPRGDARLDLTDLYAFPKRALRHAGTPHVRYMVALGGGNSGLLGLNVSSSHFDPNQSEVSANCSPASKQTTSGARRQTGSGPD